MYSKINGLSISLYNLLSEFYSERREGKYIMGYDTEGKANPEYVYEKTYWEAKEKLTFTKLYHICKQINL